jgi:hypothetical protein
MLFLRILALSDINQWIPADEFNFTQGESIYVQIMKQLPCGTEIRYIPTAGAALEIVSKNIDSSKSFTRLTSIPYADDRSIRLITVMPTDVIQAGGLSGKLIEGGKTTILPLKTILTTGGLELFC